MEKTKKVLLKQTPGHIFFYWKQELDKDAETETV